MHITKQKFIHAKNHHKVRLIFPPHNHHTPLKILTNIEKYNIHTAGCTTREILEQAHNVVYKNVKGTGIRQNCHCIPSRDIGAYNSCLSECKYCYANRKPEIPKNVIKLHYEKSPLLLGHLKKRII